MTIHKGNDIVQFLLEELGVRSYQTKGENDFFVLFVKMKSTVFIMNYFAQINNKDRLSLSLFVCTRITSKRCQSHPSYHVSKTKRN